MKNTKGKLVEFADIVKLFQDNMTLMIGGFAAVGTPEILLDAVITSKAKNLTVITNDSGYPGHGVSRLVATKQIKKLIASHIGMNPETAEQMKAGELTVELVPQGSLAEKIRCGGAGLGGALTQVGLGTEIAAGKDKITVQGKEYLLEHPLRADIALIRGSVVDEFGNIVYKAATRNFNPLMATAAGIVVAAAEQIVATGALEPETIATPGIFVDYILGGETYAR